MVIQSKRTGSGVHSYIERIKISHFLLFYIVLCCGKALMVCYTISFVSYDGNSRSKWEV